MNRGSSSGTIVPAISTFLQEWALEPEVAQASTQPAAFVESDEGGGGLEEDGRQGRLVHDG